MPPLSGFTILVIDFPEAHLLRASLIGAGARVHVVTPRGALILAGHRRIDAAFVGFGVDAETRRLCEELTDLGVGQIIVTAGNVGSARLEQERAMFPDLVLGIERGMRARQPSDLH